MHLAFICSRHSADRSDFRFVIMKVKVSRKLVSKTSIVLPIPIIGRRSFRALRSFLLSRLSLPQYFQFAIEDDSISPTRFDWSDWVHTAQARISFVRELSRSFLGLLSQFLAIWIPAFLLERERLVKASDPKRCDLFYLPGRRNSYCFPLNRMIFTWPFLLEDLLFVLVLIRCSHHAIFISFCCEHQQYFSIFR